MNKNSRIYRFWEMLPGLLAWTTILFPIIGSFFCPVAVTYFVIAFLIYWLYQSFQSAILAVIGYFKIKKYSAINWQKKFNQQKNENFLNYSKIKHVVIISSFKEPIKVIDMAIGSLSKQIDIDLKKIFIVLAQEGRAGKQNNQTTKKYFENKYKGIFADLVFTEHPPGLEGETIGKHSNEAWAAKYFKKNYIDKKIQNLDFDHTTLTSCDVDTIFHPKYFSALTYFFASDPNRYYRFWQSPIFWHHNINSVPAPIRIIGTMGNVIHIANIQEPDTLFFNYSCYSSSYRQIDSAGYWDLDVIPEDWHIFLQSFFSSGGRSSVNPIFLPTVVDAPDGKGYFDALKNRYNQCLRHAWGATDIAYAIEQSRLHSEIPILTRLLRVYKLIKTHIIWSSNWFILTLGTSLPTILNPRFFQTSFGYNLPRIANVILTICLIPLFVLIVLDWKLRPKSSTKGFKNFFKNFIQWPLMPIATLTMAVLPGLHSHTRLLFNKRLEYKTTTKDKK
ncbi:hypothetical protein DRH14_00295 [Candidatus Shapirobacteria bacterium]|nr:MAG: hypothetical protein DRH14_00295 [Candidatus Shapirobacteria bacterium]